MTTQNKSMNGKIKRIIESYASIIDLEFDSRESMSLIADLDELFRTEAI